jgi:hypothetical protein
MSKAFEEIAREARELSREQQLALARLLLELNEDPDVMAEWEQEILARIRAVDENQIEGVSFEMVMRDAGPSLRSRRKRKAWGGA